MVFLKIFNKPINWKSIQIVDGKLSDWGSWSQCSATCEGLKSRTRTCSHPQYGGAPCTGQTTQTAKCGTVNCPGIWIFLCLLQWKISVYCLIFCCVLKLHKPEVAFLWDIYRYLVMYKDRGRFSIYWFAWVF